MRSVGAPLLCVIALLATMGASAAWAEDKEADARRAAEQAFLEGRCEDVEAVLEERLETPAARHRTGWWPISVRRCWWRSGGSVSGPLSAQPQDEASRQRSRWLVADHTQGPHRPFPDLDDGGEDPYPVLTALVRDRQRRETHGHAGLPEESPLVLLAPLYDSKTHEALHYYLGENTRYWMNLAYKGYAEDEYSRRMERTAAALEARNGAWALWSLLLFVLLPVLGSLWLGRRNTPGNAQESA